MRRLILAAVIYILGTSVLLTGCTTGVKAVPPTPSNPTGSRTGVQPPVDTGKPFVAWDGKATIPFIYPVRDSSTASLESTFFLGIWDLSNGTVSFRDNPIFRISDSWTRISWDGGDRFGFVGGTVRQLDPRVQVEQVLAYGLGFNGALAAPSNSDAVIVANLIGSDRAVLNISGHPLAGEIELKPELAPNTSIFKAVGLEVGQDEVRVLFETIRGAGDTDMGFVNGVLSASYRADRTVNQVVWRMVNPQVPVHEVGGGATWGQFPGQLAMAVKERRPAVLDLVTGAVSSPPEFAEELKNADPVYVKGIQGGAEVGIDLTYGYSDYRLVSTLYSPGVPVGARSVRHVLAFKGDVLAGRLDCIDDKVLVYKGREKTFEASLPKEASGALLGFPQDVQPLSNPVAGGKTCGPAEFSAVWKRARYADLFNETLRTDGWMSDQMATILWERFVEDPKAFIRSLALAAPREAEHVGDLLSYSASLTDSDRYRKELAALRKEFAAGKESTVVDMLLIRSQRGSGST